MIKKFNFLKTNLKFNYNLKQNPNKYFLKTKTEYYYLIIINNQKIFKLEKFNTIVKPAKNNKLLNFHILKEKTQILISFHNYSPVIM